TIPPRACARATTSAPNTARASTCSHPHSAPWPRRRERPTRRSCARRDTAPSPPRSATPPPSTSPRPITSNTWRRTPGAIAASAAPAFAAADSERRAAQHLGRALEGHAIGPEAELARERDLDLPGAAQRLLARDFEALL